MREVTRGQERHAIAPAVDHRVQRRRAVAERPDDFECEHPDVVVEARRLRLEESRVHVAELSGVDRGGLPIGGEQLQVAGDERQKIDGGRAGQRRGAGLNDLERAGHQKAPHRRRRSTSQERLSEHDLRRVRADRHAHRAEGRRHEDLEAVQTERGAELADLGPRGRGLPGRGTARSALESTGAAASRISPDLRSSARKAEVRRSGAS